MGKNVGKRFRCSECGFFSQAWLGRCPNCGSWGTLQEESETGSGRLAGREGIPVVSDLGGSSAEEVPPDRRTRRVLGGGWIAGTSRCWRRAGVRKSTLLLQACASMAASGNASSMFPAKNPRPRLP